MRYEIRMMFTKTRTWGGEPIHGLWRAPGSKGFPADHWFPTMDRVTRVMVYWLDGRKGAVYVN